MIYLVLFEDGSKYEDGESYIDTNWLDMPDKNILQIGFRLPDGNWLTLKDCEEYNHIIEATQNVYGSNKFTLRYQYLMGRRGDKIISYRITLFQGKNDRYKIGDITRREFKAGEEYKGKPTSGWKKGVERNGKSSR